MKVIVFDTETTGLLLPARVPLEKQPRIIELAVVVVEDGRMFAGHDWLINPGFPISDEITKITGITNEELVDKPPFAELLPEIIETFRGADVWYAHNMPFDDTMLCNEVKRLGAEDRFPQPREKVCTVQEYRPMFGHRPKLTELYERVVGKPLIQTHRALDDATALFEVLAKNGALA